MENHQVKNPDFKTSKGKQRNPLKRAERIKKKKLKPHMAVG